jgi:Immunoglobulin I-set domain
MRFVICRYKDARELHKGAKYRMETDETLASLTISDVDHNDAGIYRCEVHNQHGRVETTGLLTVNGRDVNVITDTGNKVF